MKFLYEYRTPDNTKHSGTISASDREAAYAALKQKGIKPCRFAEAPGFFNKLFGKGKRWIAILVLGLSCAVLSILLITYQSSLVALNSSLITLNSSLDAATRRQLIGDAAVIEKGVRTGWADVFSLEGDRFLASFAIPGVPAAVRTTTEEKLKEALSANSSLITPHSSLLTHHSSFLTHHSSLITPHSSLESDSLEARQIRAIVNGMKDEMRKFIAAGGSIRQYARLLCERQDEEIAYYVRAKTEVENAAKANMPRPALEQLLERRNNSLRKLGIRLVGFPEGR